MGNKHFNTFSQIFMVSTTSMVSDFDRTPTSSTTITMQTDVKPIIWKQKWFIILLIIISIVLVAGLLCFLIRIFWFRKRNRRQGDAETGEAEQTELNQYNGDNDPYPVMATDHPENVDNLQV